MIRRPPKSTRTGHTLSLHDALPISDEHPTDVLRAVDNAPAPEGLDVRAFAGRFEGTLPCADCPGIDSALELGADGTYSLHDAYRESDGATNDVTGTWTVERSEEHTSELQSLMRISYAVFCLKKKKHT